MDGCRTMEGGALHGLARGGILVERWGAGTRRVGERGRHVDELEGAGARRLARYMDGRRTLGEPAYRGWRDSKRSNAPLRTDVLLPSSAIYFIGGAGSEL